jgi:hypothetical protein
MQKYETNACYALFHLFHNRLNKGIANATPKFTWKHQLLYNTTINKIILIKIHDDE